MNEIHTIEDVLARLDEIIRETKRENDTSGYFAALYRKVTQRIREEVEAGNFGDNDRMVKLDVVFAKRYLDAYQLYRKHEPVTRSWEKAFRLSESYWPVVMQHLLIGMNAHINLDLGIAAAEVSGKGEIGDLKNDFYRINSILTSLVDEVQENLSTVWPPLRWVLKKTGQYDNLLTDFSMRIARDGAWKFAKVLSLAEEGEVNKCIEIRDEAVASKAALITEPGPYVSLLLKIVRLGETGTISEKIEKLSKTVPE